MTRQQHIVTTLKRIAFIVLLFLIAGVIISAIQKRGNSVTKEVLIDIQPLPDGFNLINDEDVLITIQRSFGNNLTRIPITSLDVERVERVLEADPFILESDVYVNANNQVNISVVQREPLLRVIDESGKNYYLDKYGKQMPLSPHFTTRALVATGHIPLYDEVHLDEEDSILRELYDLTNILTKDAFYRPMIEQMHVEKNGEFILIPKVGNHKILLGKYADIQDKLKRLKIFYTEGLPHEGWQKYKSISLKYKGQVICKKK